ncbi:MAG: hypothetical protein IPI30_22360 [Saprospiraceae bacterium]|nr:hypothetical protein [Candidatus Vicinibacter affinis]
MRNYFEGKDKKPNLRYGENPHQKAWFSGDLNLEFLQGKRSYNNILYGCS